LKGDFSGRDPLGNYNPWIEDEERRILKMPPRLELWWFKERNKEACVDDADLRQNVDLHRNDEKDHSYKSDVDLRHDADLRRNAEYFAYCQWVANSLSHD